MRRKHIFLISLFGVLLLVAGTESLRAQIVYKVPDGVFPIDWNKSGFKGMLMLEKDSPSGIFITYPDEGEAMDSLRERAATFIAPMVVGAEKPPFHFEIKEITPHPGDDAGRAKYYFFKGTTSSVQILFFEKTTRGATVLYGYFGSKGTDERKSKSWVGDDMKDPKLLAKFVKSFN